MLVDGANHESDIHSIDDSILRLQSTKDRLRSEIGQCEVDIKTLMWRLAWLKVAVKWRAFLRRLGEFRGVVLWNIPIALGGATAVVAHLVIGVHSLSLAVGLVTIVASVFAMRRLTSVAEQGDLIAQLTNVDQVVEGLKRQAGDNTAQIQRIANEVKTLQDLKAQVEAKILAHRNSVAYRLNQLYCREWRSLRGTAFEEYLKEVFELLGFEVELTGETGDQGVDLVLRTGTVRIAVQAKGYEGSVGNSAVQEVFAGMAHYRCDYCAVVTNSRLTASAKTLARSTHCLVVDEECFEEFVLARRNFLSFAI